jgi:hypothetical protein
MIGTRKKRNRTGVFADPDLGCAGVETEGAFFVYFALGVGRGKDFDTDFGGASENDWLEVEFRPAGVKPSDVEGLHAVSGRNSAFRQGLAVGQELVQKPYNSVLAARMAKTWRRSHQDMSVPIGLDPVRQVRQPGICTDCSPASQVEGSLRLEIQELDCDGHAGKIRQKWKNA